ncbi:hypothetical protein GGH94_004033 [Coemansia aciculifera]|uniref:Nucleoside diphosphate kinase n=1 Tax=Coemansia aciculifera TaxID=417176 RepID=A0A9W8IIW9_9FUNG|nr:hypothetical protein GGH94_004033 [Coemansia aciculifera]
MFLGRSSQRPHVGVFSGPLPSSSSPQSSSSSSFKPAAHLGVSLLFENINTTLRSSDIPTLGPRYSDSSTATTLSKHDMGEDQGANRTFAIVKPDALTPFKYQQINALIKLNEFEITRQKLVWLDDEQAAALFPERAAAADRREWLEYITCAPCLALELAKADAPLFWQLTMGAEDPNDVGGRDSDSIRGIIATDRIRNAVDGSQEPEDAVKQLRLAFSEAIPALPYDDFLMQRADDAHCTLALVKPDVAQDEQAVATIIGRITARGYTIKDRVEITLSRAQASAFYAEHSDRPFFEGLVAFMSSGPTVALLLEGDDVVRGWRMMVGPTSPATARQQMPQSIRALLGDDGPRNAVHGSDSAESAQRELGFFFHPRIQAEVEEEPPTPAETAVENLSVSVSAVSIADAGSEDKKKKKKKPKRRTKRKQPVTANVDGPVSALANETGALSDDSDDEPGPFSADSSAPITPAATHIRFDQLVGGPAGDVANAVEPANGVAGTVELAVAADPAHERTFALIKPDAYPRHHKKIIKHIVERGLSVIAQEEVQLTAAVANHMYTEMTGFPTYTRLIDFVTSGPALALVLEGPNAIAVLRSLVGPTNPRSAKFEAPNSLRAKFGQDAQVNAVHASKDLREVCRSIDAVFYGLLGGDFRILQPTDDPLAAITEPQQPADAKSIETGASTDVDVTPDQFAAPLTPPQTKAPAGEKVHPLGNRLASSPFLKADRQLSTDSPSATKRVGRIKSPFLSDGRDDAAVFAAPAIAAAAAAATPEPSLTNGDGDHEHAPSEAVAEPETEPEAETEIQPEQEQEKEQENVQLHEKLAELQLDSNGQADDELPATNGTAPKAPVAPPKTPQSRPVPARTAARPVPASATTQRTVRRPPVTGPAAPATATAATTSSRRTTLGPSTTVAAAARRTTLGPSSTAATRARVAPATPTTPSVTTRSAARATGATPLASRTTTTRTTPTKASAPVVAARRAVATATAAAATPAARPTAVRSTPTARPVITTATTRPAARAALAPVTPTRSSVAATAAPRVRAVPASTVTATTPTAPKRTSAPGAAAAATAASPIRNAPSSASTTPTRAAPIRTATLTRTAAARPAPTTAAASASPRPVTRSMSTTVGVSSTASSRARAAAAAAAKTDESVRPSAAPGASSRPSTARPSAAPGAPARAGVPARPARAAAPAAPATKPAPDTKATN